MLLPKKLICLVCIILVVILLTGCPIKRRKDVLIFSLGGDATFLNPILYTDSASGTITGTVFNGLIRINESLEVIPDLAEKWDISQDGLVWTFHLREDVKWHDGGEFTSEDVKFTFDKILDKKTNTVRRSDYIIDDKPIEFSVVDKHTFKAVLPKPFAPFLVSMGMGIIPKHILEKEDINKADFNRAPVGTGPFKFAEWKTASHIILTANKDYFRGTPKLNQIIYKIIPDSNARLVALKTGEVDVSDIRPKDYEEIKKSKRLNVFDYEALSYTYLGYNLSNPIFSDSKVRAALAYAVNKKEMVDVIFKGLASPATQPQSPVSWAYNKNAKDYPYDPLVSKESLEQLGWKLKDDEFRYKDGKKFEFTVITNKGNKEREQAAAVLQQMFKNVGVKMNIQVMEWSAELKILNARKDPKDFDAVVIGWGLGIDPDDYSIWHSSQYPGGFNFIKYQNKYVDRLIEQGRTQMEKEKRKTIYGSMYEIIAEEQPYLFLWYPKALVAVDKKVKGLSKPGPVGLFLELEKVYIE